MGFRIGIVGGVNSGKSFARRTITDGENVFILYPSQKATHLTTSDGKPVKTLNITNKQNDAQATVMNALKVTTVVGLLKNLQSREAGKLTPYISGNRALVRNINDLTVYLDFIDKHMPWIHTIFLADFTHFISEIISKKDFIDRQSGGQAYQKFWELSGNALQSFISKSDSLREDLIVVTEYHTEVDPMEGLILYVPAGKMLREKFKPESYYDVLLVTKVIPNEDGEITKDSYKFTTRRTTDAPIARSMEIFEETYIPNDMQLVLDKVKENLGIEHEIKEQGSTENKTEKEEEIIS